MEKWGRNTFIVFASHSLFLTYVLTDKFYSKDKVNASVFEKLVINYLEGNILNVNELETYINNYETWNTENQFYCIPILMLLIKDSINNTFVRL
jgi:hypothetical protein